MPDSFMNFPDLSNPQWKVLYTMKSSLSKTLRVLTEVLGKKTRNISLLLFMRNKFAKNLLFAQFFPCLSGINKLKWSWNKTTERCSHLKLLSLFYIWSRGATPNSFDQSEIRPESMFMYTKLYRTVTYTGHQLIQIILQLRNIESYRNTSPIRHRLYTWGCIITEAHRLKFQAITPSQIRKCLIWGD